MKADIGIIGAMEIEVENLKGMLEDPSEHTVSGVIFYTGRLYSKNVAIARCGIGKVFAAICATAMILEFSPKLIINTGVGGALARGLSTGDVVIADRLCQHDMDTSAIGDPVGLISGINMVWLPTSERAVSILKNAAESIGVKATVGSVATGDRFIATKEDKERITTLFGASACEMEGGAIAQTCYAHSVPCAVVRAISDNADGEAELDYPTFLPIAAKNSTAMTLALVKEF